MNTDPQNGFQATVVLVHGAFAESASWNEVIRRLTDDGYTALAAAIPSWFVFPELDKNIPVAVHRFMAERAQAHEVVEIEGASHAFTVSHPDEVADVILHAVRKFE